MNGHDYWAACFRQLGGARRDMDARMRELDLDRVARDALGGDVPGNLAALRLTPGGSRLAARIRAVLDDTPLRTTLLLDSSLAEPVTVTVDGVGHEVPAGGARLVEITSASTVIAENRSTSPHSPGDHAARHRVEPTGVGADVRPSRRTADSALLHASRTARPYVRHHRPLAGSTSAAAGRATRCGRPRATPS
ncbi:hypothetical protein ACIBP6_01970 [Nonomuraea terrae]|uniref:hypothetical protein n=1 Tax=Nonomuraea terrae TaxID=2530383 RepID=UPI0037A28390